MPVVCVCAAHSHIQYTVLCATLNKNFLASLSRWGCRLIRGIPKFHHSLKLVCQSMTLFEPLLLIITFQEITIKHLMYMQKVPFLYTERACGVFSSFEIPPGRFCVSKKCCKYFRPEGVHFFHSFNTSLCLLLWLALHV